MPNHSVWFQGQVKNGLKHFYNPVYAITVLKTEPVFNEKHFYERDEKDTDLEYTVSESQKFAFT